MIDLIGENIMIVANNYVYALFIISILFAYHYDYKSLKKKGLIKESKISKGIVIVYTLLLIGLIISKQVIEMKMF